MKRAKGINKYLGLMFKSRKTEPLLFEFSKPVYIPIHSWFVFFTFLVEWTLEDETIEYRVIKPFQSKIYASKPYIKLLEVPL